MKGLLSVLVVVLFPEVVNLSSDEILLCFLRVRIVGE